MKKLVFIFILFCHCSFLGKQNFKSQCQSLKLTKMMYDYNVLYCDMPEDIKQDILFNILKFEEDLKMKGKCDDNQ